MRRDTLTPPRVFWSRRLASRASGRSPIKEAVEHEQASLMIDFPRAHLIGAGGAGMSAIRAVLESLGVAVTGSDLRAIADPRFHTGHTAGNLPDEEAIVIFSPAIAAENPERREAARRGWKQISGPEFLGELTRLRDAVCVAGTHGKTTVAAMIAWVLHAAGRSPTPLIGGQLTQPISAAGAGLLVVESCEYRRGFCTHHPKFALITSIEHDHVDCFARVDDVRAAFREFAAQGPPGKSLLVHVSAADVWDNECITYGPGGDWEVTREFDGEWSQRLVIKSPREVWPALIFAHPGRHMAENALAAAALCGQLGLSPGEVIAALERFPGVKRRLQRLTTSDVVRIDDYAHHPTAVRGALEAVRESYPRNRVFVGFQPHQAGRARAMLAEFADAFAPADDVFVLPVFPAREEHGPHCEAISRELVSQIRGPRAAFSPSLESLAARVDDEACPGDVVVSLGASDVHLMHPL